MRPVPIYVPPPYLHQFDQPSSNTNKSSPKIYTRPQKPSSAENDSPPKSCEEYILGKPIMRCQMPEWLRDVEDSQ
jgi:hypothetical protein